MRFRQTRAVLWTVGALWAATISAAPIADFSSLFREFGSGAQQIAIVIDWTQNDTPDAFAWGLRFDTAPASVADALLLLESFDSTLDFRFTDFGFGLFLDGVEMSSPYRLADRNGGWSETFSVWQGQASDETWGSSVSGISDTPVQDGFAYGFAWNPNAATDFTGTPPNAIPEPNTVLVLLFGLAVLRCARRCLS
jgi:hypothetical protein